jgi:hypothetical protein
MSATYITPHFIGSQFPTMVQLITRKNGGPIIIAPIPTMIHVNTSLPTHILRDSTHQPLDGGQPRDSPRGS